MRKPVFSLCLCILIVLTGCSGLQKNLTTHGEAFIEKLYTVQSSEPNDSKMQVKDYEHMHKDYLSYVTEDAFNELSFNNTIYKPYEIAEIIQGKIMVSDITFKKDQFDQARGTYYYDHSFKLQVKNQEGNVVHDELVKGQMTFVDTKEGVKIKRYQDNATLERILDPTVKGLN